MTGSPFFVIALTAVHCDCPLGIYPEKFGIILQKTLKVHLGRKNIVVTFFESLQVFFADLGDLGNLCNLELTLLASLFEQVPDCA
ncbi:MAG: hypothetical protein TR69_WS6001001016 [candidate division WS6 bacterium OLB20]|uniref:Uncharacterized protein n=1 Tax=candidate division WS6 bacterium OLB20 TaxID=1617426 RepID=A0A136LZC0_9BACT|nr:MAG: hypothetical protein TR69_WS6001001016 [candidate division WS6 bacterium OLB20]